MAHGVTPYLAKVNGDGYCIANNIRPRPQGVLINFYRANISGGSKTKLNDQPLDVDGYLDTQPNGTTRYYSATWVTNGVESAFSAEIAVTATANTDTVPRKEWECRINALDNNEVEHSILVGDYVYACANGGLYKVNIFNGLINRAYEMVPNTEWNASQWLGVTAPVYCQVQGQNALIFLVKKVSVSPNTCRLICVNEQTGARIWDYTVNRNSFTEGMSYHDGHIYVTFSNGIEKRSIETGEIDWVYSANFDGSCSLYDPVTNCVFAFSSSRGLVKIEADTGQEISALSISPIVDTGHYSIPFITEASDPCGRKLFFPGLFGHIFKADPDNFTSIEQTWTCPDPQIWNIGSNLKRYFPGSFCYHNGEIYAQGLMAKVYCLDASDFSIKWKWDCPPESYSSDNFWAGGALDEDYFYHMDHCGYNPSLGIFEPRTQYLWIIDRVTGQTVKRVSSSQFTNSCFVAILSQGMLITGEWYSDESPDSAGHLIGWKVREEGTKVDSPVHRGSELRHGFFPQSSITTPVLGTPTITLQDYQATAFTTGQNLTEADIIRYFFGTDPDIDQTDTEMLNGNYDFTGLPGTYYAIAGINRDGQWYWSEPSEPFTIERQVGLISLSPSTVTIKPTGQVQFLPTILDTEGEEFPKQLNWSVSDPTKATITQDGFFTSSNQGTGGITVTAQDPTPGGVFSTAVVTIESFAPANPYYHHPYPEAGAFMAGELGYYPTPLGADYGMAGTFMAGEIEAGAYFGKKAKMEFTGDIVTKYAKKVRMEVLGDITVKYAKMAKMEVAFDYVKLEKMLYLVCKFVDSLQLSNIIVSDLVLRQHVQGEFEAKVTVSDKLTLKNVFSKDLVLKEVE